MPLCYIKRNKILAGEYLIFYRAAFKTDSASPKPRGSKMCSPFSLGSKQHSAMSAKKQKTPTADGEESRLDEDGDADE